MFRRLSSPCAALVAALSLSTLLGWATPACAQEGKQDYSRAEQLVFMNNQLGQIKPPTTLRYSFRKTGTLEESFQDDVTITLTKDANGPCCRAQGSFLSGARRLDLPEIEKAEANPVILYFLEHDVRDMKRLTKGSPAYYRKRIRMAIYNAAAVTDVSLLYQGRSVNAQRVEITPYADDPARSRFEKFARKTYQFYLAEAVPGGVYGIRTVMRSEAADAAPMIVEELFLQGAVPPKDQSAR